MLLTDVLVVWVSKPSGRRFSGLGLKTQVEVSRRNRAVRGGIIEVVSRQSKSMKEAWPFDRQRESWTRIPLGLAGSRKISRGTSEIV